MKISPLNRVALFITRIVSSMYCAIAFTILALISLPSAISGGIGTTISWIAQTFLQLVLLSIIMVGQDLQNKQAEDIARKHYQTLLRHEKKIDKVLKSLSTVVKIKDK